MPQTITNRYIRKITPRLTKYFNCTLVAAPMSVSGPTLRTRCRRIVQPRSPQRNSIYIPVHRPESTLG